MSQITEDEQPASQQTSPAQMRKLIQAGQLAYSQGDLHKAHDYWRQAALLQPDNESIWLSLLKVVDNAEDRRVCLENIRAINPRNREAARQLRQYYMLRGMPPPDNLQPANPWLKVAGRALLIIGRLVLIGVLLLGLFLLGLLAGVAFNLITITP